VDDPVEVERGSPELAASLLGIIRPAATALLYDLPLVTHNHGDYRGVPGLALISHSV
jgi:hypothetical protein